MNINQHKYNSSADSSIDQIKSEVTLPNIKVSYETNIPMRRFKNQEIQKDVAVVTVKHSQDNFGSKSIFQSNEQTSKDVLDKSIEFTQ